MSNDITMCLNQECPIKHSCKRFSTIDMLPEYQSVFVEDPCEWHDDWFYCIYFWDTKEERKQLKLIDKFIKEDFNKYGDVFQRLADYDKNI